jgi:hypothetical protein
MRIVKCLKYTDEIFEYVNDNKFSVLVQEDFISRFYMETNTDWSSRMESKTITVPGSSMKLFPYTSNIYFISLFL